MIATDVDSHGPIFSKKTTDLHHFQVKVRYLLGLSYLELEGLPGPYPFQDPCRAHGRVRDRQLVVWR